MKKLFTSLLLLGCASAFAQTPFNTRDSININKINAMVLVHGDMWWNPTPAAASSHCYFPNGTTKSISSTGAIWMSGYDGGNQLHTAAQTYRQNGNDYWPGPLDASGNLDSATSRKWAKIWKVNRTDVYHFQHLLLDGTANATTIPGAIWTWPAKGNANAQGNAGAPLTITTDMAPFVDVNGDGVYQPLLGDYPKFNGEQALWWVFSDKGPTHNETNGTPLGVEVRSMAYAYNRGTIIDNVVYYEFNVTNKSATNYHNFRIGQMADMDLGYYNDDYIGIDTARALAYVYNGGPIDAVYGHSMPKAGIKVLEIHPDAGSVGLGSFTYYNNDNSLIGNPTTDTEYNNYLRSKIRGGQHVTNDFTGYGSGSRGYGPGPEENFVFSGGLSDSTYWTECNAANMPGDRRFVLGSHDMTLNAGGQLKYAIALLATEPDTTNSCGNDGLSTLHIFDVSDTAAAVYNGGGLTPVPDAVGNVSAATLMNVYPNPAPNQLYIETSVNSVAANNILVYNTVGQLMNVTINNDGKRYIADIAQLPNGIYYLKCNNGNNYSVVKFLKQ